MFVTPAGSSPTGTPAISRDRTIGAVGHRTVQPRSTDLGGSSPGKLHVGGQGHRVVASPRVDTRCAMSIRDRLGSTHSVFRESVLLRNRVPDSRGGPAWHRAHRRSCSCDPPAGAPVGSGGWGSGRRERSGCHSGGAGDSVRSDIVRDAASRDDLLLAHVVVPVSPCQVGQMRQQSLSARRTDSSARQTLRKRARL